jgi:hypothetical protein
MNNKIKNRAQEVYPVTEKAECYTAFLQGASVAQQELIYNACNWLEDNLYNPKYEIGTWKESKSQFIDDFRKAMEG